MTDLDYSRGRYWSAKAHLDGAASRLPSRTPQILLLVVKVERKLGSRKRVTTYAELLRKRYPHSPQLGQL